MGIRVGAPAAHRRAAMQRRPASGSRPCSQPPWTRRRRRRRRRSRVSFTPPPKDIRVILRVAPGPAGPFSPHSSRSRRLMRGRVPFSTGVRWEWRPGRPGRPLDVEGQLGAVTCDLRRDSQPPRGGSGAAGGGAAAKSVPAAASESLSERAVRAHLCR
jgi:hypothetical protein